MRENTVISSKNNQLLRSAYQVLFDADNKGTNFEGSVDILELIKQLCHRNRDLPLLPKLYDHISRLYSKDPSKIYTILRTHNRVFISGGWSCRKSGNHSVYFMLEKKKRIKLVDIIEEKSTSNIVNQIKKSSS